MRRTGSGAWRSRSIPNAVLSCWWQAGVAQKRFNQGLIAKADARFAEHLDMWKGN